MKRYFFAKKSCFYVLGATLLVLLFLAFFLSLPIDQKFRKDRPVQVHLRGFTKIDTVAQAAEPVNLTSTLLTHGHRLAVIVPYRHRFEELLKFVPSLHKFLLAKEIPHKIFVINQIDYLRFNRASLINIGFLEARSVCDYIAMHDVDLIPLNMQLDYSYPAEGPFHVASPNLHPKYHYQTFIGGILLISNTHFEKVNGMSNRYWGWGREDDEFFVRLRFAKLKLFRPAVRPTHANATFLHLHDGRNRQRDNKRYFGQFKKTSRLDRQTGFSTVRYTIESQYDLSIDGAPCTIYNVQLKCDYAATPWCTTPARLQQLVQAGRLNLTQELDALLKNPEVGALKLDDSPSRKTPVRITSAFLKAVSDVR